MGENAIGIFRSAHVEDIQKNRRSAVDDVSARKTLPQVIGPVHLGPAIDVAEQRFSIEKAILSRGRPRTDPGWQVTLETLKGTGMYVGGHMAYHQA